jgi:hypothetical protein
MIFSLREACQYGRACLLGCAKALDELHRGFVGAAMQWAAQGTDAGGNAG